MQFFLANSIVRYQLPLLLGKIEKRQAENDDTNALK